MFVYIYICYIYIYLKKQIPNYSSKKDRNMTKQMDRETVTMYRLTALFPEIQANPRPSMSKVKICRTPKMLPNVTWAKTPRTKDGSGKINCKGKRTPQKNKMVLA